MVPARGGKLENKEVSVSELIDAAFCHPGKRIIYRDLSRLATVPSAEYTQAMYSPPMDRTTLSLGVRAVRWQRQPLPRSGISGQNYSGRGGNDDRQRAKHVHVEHLKFVIEWPLTRFRSSIPRPVSP